jgi:hypothetical protein
MKIIKKPKLPIQKCERCRCEFEIKPKDIQDDPVSLTIGFNPVVYCPVCQYKIHVDFNSNNVVIELKKPHSKLGKAILKHEKQQNENL